MNEKVEKLMVLVAVLVIGLAAKVTNADLVAHWPLDETSGTTAGDSSGRGHDGVLKGGLSFDQRSVEGKIGKALHLTGAEGAAIFADSVSVPTSAFTVSLWFNPDSDLDQGSGKFYLMYWAGSVEDSGTKPLYEFNEDERGTMRLCVQNDGAEQHKLETKKNSWKASTWYHLVATFDGNYAKLYVDGILEDSASQPGTHGASSRVCFGGRHDGQYPFRGKFDDIRIYDQALSADEISMLKWPADPALKELIDAVQQGEAMIKEKGAKKAIAFLEKKITESERWRERNPDKVQLLVGVVTELSLQLVKAKEAAGFPKKDIVDGYKHLIESGKLSLASYTSALAGLYDNTSADEYQSILGAIVQNDRDYLLEACAKAGMMVSQQRPRLAVAFLEATLASYSTWHQEHPHDVVAGEERLPEIYFQLAKVKEAAGAPKADIAKAYGKTFTAPSNECVPERTAGLIWLLENGQSNEYAEAIKSFVQLGDIREPFTTIVRNVCRDFESRRSWAGFERFLDTVVAESRHPIEWLAFMDTCLINKANRWAKKYSEYLDSKPRLKFRVDRVVAAENMAAKDFKKAAESYQDILSRCGPDDDKGEFEFQLGKCLFYGGEYQQAISRLDNFIANYKTAHGNLVKEATLMKSQGHVHSGELDKALDSYFALMIEYPETEDLPEISFFLGYCYMLKDDLEAAEKAFDSVIKSYPDSPYATKATMCMIRIKHNREAG
ncbi:MAG: LamG-like jellyroll fold domain-containing protein [Planctomycetota bacterium]|jgi:TolA-binding protein